MQTFLPYPDFVESARCLDKQRLGNQRNECVAILRSLRQGAECRKREMHPGVWITVWGAVPYPLPSGERVRVTPWWDHPALQMWRGHELSLCRYMQAIVDEWRRRGSEDMTQLYLDEFRRSFELRATTEEHHADPAWLGDDLLHRSHRSNLLRKMPGWYGRYGWGVPADLPYHWPVEVEVTR